MGWEFSNLIQVRYFISYSLSPFEQKAFPSYFTKGILNLLHRTQDSILQVTPPFIGFYFLYTWGTQEFEKSKRKKPTDFEEEK
ncbi:cytochrome b-c1 complex subunit 8-like [Dromiciops gliroides]|uniref:cytochrome b-c1 complex subunit 8-like n=1 Tax=Dromiciops gliroides TaxID=33562 RepID=UPI001CC40C69|nr:cytochrome b-c1 complex subunit 8-like [Dromiciops gliroides]